MASVEIASGWRKVGALALGVTAVGLPVNHVGVYALLVILAVVVFSGEVNARPRAWLAAAAIVAVACAVQFLLAPPRIEEGHNAFLPKADVLQRGLPADVYRHMQDAFDAAYPPAVRCRLDTAGCWQGGGLPDRVYAFSADGIWHKSDASRSVTALDFSDPVWLHLGFINESRYNWYSTPPDVHRVERDRRFFMGWRRWHLAMPWFEMLRLPAAFAGGELCWRGDVMWEGGSGAFAALPQTGCRAIEPADAGRRIFGVAMKADTLAMQVKPPWSVRLRQLGQGAFMLGAILGVVILLVRVRPRRTIVPFLLIGLAMIVIAVDDASFLGGVRPFDGGGDGLFYEGVGRMILQKFLAGDVYEALRGGENVFYYGGPGLRYFRALEHVVFGETYLGYLSLILALPFVVYLLFRRFLPPSCALGLAIVFIAIPVGTLFGTSFIDYAKWAAVGYADPIANMLFLAGMTIIVGFASGGPTEKFVPAFFGALLLALGICMKPIVAPAAAVLLGGCGVIALYLYQFRRLAGLCIGFLPVFSMALHNWVYGRAFVLFSANAADADLLVMPPSAYIDAAREIMSLQFIGPHVARAGVQLSQWLSGTAESYFTIPLNAAGIAVLIWVVCRGRQFDPWLRLLGAAGLAQQTVALFYSAAVARYHFLAWFLTALVSVVWFHDVGVAWLRRNYPVLSGRFAGHAVSQRLASGIARLRATTDP